MMRRTTVTAAVAISLLGCGADESEAPDDPCAWLAPVTDRAEAAETPRDDVHAEGIAMLCSDGYFPDDGLYEQVRADLAAMAAVRPEVADLPDHTLFTADSLAVLASAGSAEGNAALAASSELACLSDLVGGEIVPPSDSRGPIVVSSARFDAPSMADLLRAVPGVETASTDGLVGDGDRLRWRVRDGLREWHVSEGLGDCPSGCAARHDYWFRIEADGSATLVEEWASGALESLGDDASTLDPDLPREAPASMGGEFGCSRCNGTAIRHWDPATRPTEVCGNGIDDDCDGAVDCDDPDCDTDAACPIENCANGADDDGDGRVDCDDPECERRDTCADCTLSAVYRSASLDAMSNAHRQYLACGADDACISDGLAPDDQMGEETFETCVVCWLDWKGCVAAVCGDACDGLFGDDACQSCVAETTCEEELTVCLEPWAPTGR